MKEAILMFMGIINDSTHPHMYTQPKWHHEVSCSLRNFPWNEELKMELSLGRENCALAAGQWVCFSTFQAQSSLVNQDNSGYFKPFAPSPSLTAHLFVKIAGSEACKETGWRCTAYIERARKASIHDRPRPSPRHQGHGPGAALLDLGVARVKEGKFWLKLHVSALLPLE